MCMVQSFSVLGELAFWVESWQWHMSRPKRCSEFSRGLCGLLCLGQLGFHFGPKLSRVAHYICPGLSISAGLKKSSCWALTLSSQWLSCHFSQWLCQAVVFSALGKQIHKEQIIAFFNLIDNFWFVLQPTNKHSSPTLCGIWHNFF